MSRFSFAFFTSLGLRTACLGVIALLLLSGCQNGPAPASSLSETSSTTASPTLSGSASPASAGPSTAGAYKPADAKGKAQNVPVPVMPELAKENSKAGLEAFIRYWYAVNYANETDNWRLRRGLRVLRNAELCTSLQKAVATDSYTERPLDGRRRGS